MFAKYLKNIETFKTKKDLYSDTVFNFSWMEDHELNFSFFQQNASA